MALPTSTPATMRLVRWAAAMVALVAAGCGDDGAVPDGGQPDAGVIPDAGAPDVGTRDAGPATEPVTLMTAQGPVVGLRDLETGVESFRGVPYAAPPVGELRFRPPAPAPLHMEPLDASGYGPACPQLDAVLIDEHLGKSEDCLTLNVWRPAGAADLPVLVFLHGGAFLHSSANHAALYDGARLAARGAVVVTLNYRLGLLGFLAHRDLAAEDPDGAAGNYGLLDQIAALSWVRDHVVQLGGDPDRLAVFGESAGAMSVCALLVSPLAEGLFSRAIMESGSCLSRTEMLTREAGYAQADRLVSELDCSAFSSTLECLRGVAAEDVVALQDGMMQTLAGPERAEPVVDGRVLPDTVAALVAAGRTHDVPLLAGSNLDEGTLFAFSFAGDEGENIGDIAGQLVGEEQAPGLVANYDAARFGGDGRAAAAAMIRDVVFRCPTRRVARDHRRAGRSVFAYHFVRPTELGDLLGIGVFHGAELYFVFGGDALRAEERPLSDAVMDLWISFASDGVPSADTVTWDPFELDTEPLLELDLEPRGIHGWPGAADCDFIDGLGLWDEPG